MTQTVTQTAEPIYRFSEAPIWEWQRSYYEELGIKAWHRDEVPQYITSNPMIARAYAEMIFGFLQDRAKLGYSSETVSVVELGAGSGRLAFLVLMELCELRDIAGITIPPFRYIMTDLAFENIVYWQNHRSLIPFVEQGVLDFARFDAIADSEIRLTQSGTVIQVGDLQQPLLIVANYFFDSIPQELLYVGDGKILECRVSMELPDGAAALSATELLEQVELDYHYHRTAEYELTTYPYYDLILLYREKLEDSHILFPAIGMGCLERLGQLSREGFMLLTADKGDHRLESWEYAEPPKLIVHGSFSLTANYHAIQYWLEGKGAESHFTKHHHANLNVGCILMVQDPHSYTFTRLAYRRNIERFGPDDFFSMKQWFDNRLEKMGMRQILALWRLSGHDAEWLQQCGKRITILLPRCSEEEMEDFRRGIHSMWRTYYSMDEKLNLALNCGLLLFQMEFYLDALQFLELALEHGETGIGVRNENEEDALILYHSAICCYEISRDADALDYTLRTLVIEPEHEGALSLRALLEEGS